MRVKKGLCSPHAALGNMAHCSTQWRRIVGAASADATLSIPHVCRGMKTFRKLSMLKEPSGSGVPSARTSMYDPTQAWNPRGDVCASVPGSIGAHRRGQAPSLVAFSAPSR